MSRRPQNQPPDRASQNQQTLKTLVKVETNKSCADCKRNKHPRWASWNLGVFLCIRCSGIHRGMGTHISRVKSVDLDAWTDEQIQSILRWGNARANKYWEAKLAPGHVPAEAKIENFIRTKYESRRWVMDGGIPDPATLDAEGDDEVPLNIVQEKAKLERSASQRAATTSVPAQAPLKRQQQQVNLFDEFPEAAPAPRSNSAAPAPAPGRAPQAPPPTSAAPQKPPAKAGESLLGFDFFGSSQSNPPSRPSSAAASTANSTMPSRPDLKQSILSLYSSAAKNPTSGQQQQAHSRSVSQQAPGGGLDDAFSSLSFSSQPQSPPLTQSQSSPFANLAGPTSKPVTSPPASMSSARPSSIGGNFFDSKPQIKPGPAPPITTTSVPQPPRVQRGLSSSSGFGDFTSPESPKAPEPPIKTPNNGVNDLFDFSEPAQPALPAQPIKPTQPIAPSTTSTFSPFNLSAPKPASQPAPPPQSVSQPQPPSSTSATSSVANASSMMNMDPWGSGDAWASSTSPGASKPPLKSAPTTSMDFGGGWESHGSGGAKTPPQSAKITAEEDFGGWESSAPTSAQASNTTAVPKPAGGMGGADDLFSNVWE